MSIRSVSTRPQFTAKSSPASEIGASPSCAVLNFSNLQRGPSRNGNLSRRLCRGSANGGFGQNPHGVCDGDGVIIVDHGSRRKESNLMLNEFVSMFRERTGYPVVVAAHMELAEPSIRDAFSSCVEQGANRVVVSPFFLSPGRHWNTVAQLTINIDGDIPSLTAEAAKEHPGVSHIVTAPLGLHHLLVDVLNDRINHCISHVAGDAEECAVCAGTNKCQLH
ncbi:sirohydrochlorin ferrochelatase, chloroplastic-like [Pyrus x bretschneideri]|uniref:sirohydrochlorin ferrochelatase, chloroplastic-like n=1 Tax=Pyrus x bretschneideri TaxID=225117 RepID=UPI00202E62B1|nr:sirohydrochlorin ferrochelatase, chloroplastic-like [Pyrus x bretschneideri]